MIATKKGQRCAQGLPLRRALNEWCELNERIAKEWGGDVPWWYNERASLSVLAGAIASSGDFAFEEFSNEKRKASPRTSKVHLSYNGRVDLYFNIRRKDFIAEAKMCWPRCGRLHPTRQKMIERFLAHACHDVAISAPYGQRRLGLLFVAPRWKRNLKGRLIHELMHGFPRFQRSIVMPFHGFSQRPRARFMPMATFTPRSPFLSEK